MRNVGELTIFITGSTDGLGERVATDLAGKGATILLHGRDPEKGRRSLAAEQAYNPDARRRLRELSYSLTSMAKS